MIDCALSVTKNTKNLHLYPPALLRTQQWKSHPQLGISWQHWHFIKLLLHVTMNIHQLCLYIHVLAIFYVTVCIKHTLEAVSMLFYKKDNSTSNDDRVFHKTRQALFLPYDQNCRLNFKLISHTKETFFLYFGFVTRCSRP